jgi:hypothetical protein
MTLRQRIADRFRRWMHGDRFEDWYRRQLEADLNDREAVEEARER